MNEKILNDQTKLMQKLRPSMQRYYRQPEDLLEQIQLERRFCVETGTPAEAWFMGPILSWKVRQRLQLMAAEPFSIMGMHALPFRPTGLVGDVDFSRVPHPSESAHV